MNFVQNRIFTLCIFPKTLHLKGVNVIVVGSNHPTHKRETKDDPFSSPKLFLTPTCTLSLIHLHHSIQAGYNSKLQVLLNSYSSFLIYIHRSFHRMDFSYLLVELQTSNSNLTHCSMIFFGLQLVPTGSRNWITRKWVRKGILNLEHCESKAISDCKWFSTCKWLPEKLDNKGGCSYKRDKSYDTFVSQ